MKSLDSIIESVKPTNKASLSEAVNLTLLESERELGRNNVSVGDTVCMQDDPTYPEGSYGKVKSIDEEHGYAEVEWPNGTTLKAMISLLLPVK